MALGRGQLWKHGNSPRSSDIPITTLTPLLSPVQKQLSLKIPRDRMKQGMVPPPQSHQSTSTAQACAPGSRSPWTWC